MKKAAVCGAAAPRMRTMLVGALMNWLIWFRKEPAMKVAKNTVTTCRRNSTMNCKLPLIDPPTFSACTAVQAVRQDDSRRPERA